MVRKIRRWLARKLLPYDAETAAEFGCVCLSAWLDITGCNYLEFERSRDFRKFVFHEVGGEWECETLTLQCQICTNRFEAGLDGPTSCPSCHSRDIQVVE